MKKTEKKLITKFLKIAEKGYIKGINNSGNSVDRKSTRLNSSHVAISYAVFCMKKKINIVAKQPSTEHNA